MTAVPEPSDALIEAIRAEIREKALDRFLSEALTPDARNWVAGFAARAAYAAMVEHRRAQECQTCGHERELHPVEGMNEGDCVWWGGICPCTKFAAPAVETQP